MEGLLLAVIITVLIIGLIPAYIAKGKGKDFLTWYIYGVCLFFFAMIHAIVLPEKRQDQQPLAQNNQPLAQKVKDGTIPLKEVPSVVIYDEPLIVDLNCPIELISYKIKIPENYDSVFANMIPLQ